MNTYTCLGAAELLLGAVLLGGASFVATNLPDWLLRPAVMRVLTLVLGLAVVVVSAWYLVTELQAGYFHVRALTWGALGLTVLFASRRALEEEALRFAERVSRWHIDRRLSVGLMIVGLLLLLAGFVTLRNGLQGLTA